MIKDMYTFLLQVYFMIQRVLEELRDPEALAFREREEAAKFLVVVSDIDGVILSSHFPLPLPILPSKGSVVGALSSDILDKLVVAP